MTIGTEHLKRLDYHELESEKQFREGSNGIVFLGNYRGDTVVIKRMKQIADDSSDTLMNELERE